VVEQGNASDLLAVDDCVVGLEQAADAVIAVAIAIAAVAGDGLVEVLNMLVADSQEPERYV